MLKLNYNENPVAPYSKFFDKTKEELSHYNRYPSLHGDELIKQLAIHHNFDCTNIVVGNGSVELISIISSIIAKEGSMEAILPKSTFAAIPDIFQLNGLKNTFVEFKNWHIVLDDFFPLISADTRLIYLDNPNNPTGSWNILRDVDQFLKGVPPHITVIIDEAYIEYLDNYHEISAINLIEKYPNLIVTRTFSKAWGLAALRIGYAIGSTKKIASVKRKRLPFSTNVVAINTAQQILACREQLNFTRENNNQVRQMLYDFFDKNNIEYLPSHTNFIAFKPKKDAMTLFNYMQKNGILLSPLTHCAMPDYLRISLGTLSEINLFIKTYPKSSLASTKY